MSTFDYQGYKIWYEESGAGEPLVFLHNGGNDHRIWDHQVAHFSKSHRVIALDHIGHGNSDRPSIDYTLPLFTGEVAAMVEQLGLAPVTLIGHCIGAAMSLNYALQNPASVRRLVFFNVATEKTLLAGPLADVYRNFSRDPAARKAFVDGIEQNGMPREQTAGGLQMQLGSTRPDDDPEFADYIHRLYNQRGQMRTLYNNLSCFDTFRVLDEFTKPAYFPPVLLAEGAIFSLMAFWFVDLKTNARQAPSWRAYAAVYALIVSLSVVVGVLAAGRPVTSPRPMLGTATAWWIAGTAGPALLLGAWKRGLRYVGYFYIGLFIYSFLTFEPLQLLGARYIGVRAPAGGFAPAPFVAQAGMMLYSHLLEVVHYFAVPFALGLIRFCDAASLSGTALRTAQ